VGLLGLPALWSSSEPERTLRLLAETLVEVLSLQACAVVASVIDGQAPCAVLYVDGQPVDPGADDGWRRFMTAGRAERHELSRTQETTPLGALHVARFSLGYYGGEGKITVAARRPGFPSPTELVLLRSAASLAASGLRTARLVHERELALRAKDEFLAMLGHELRNPLAPIVTALELIKLRGSDRFSPEHVIIERQLGHLRRLVDDLLDVTRITTGKTELQLELLDVHSVVQAAVEAAQPLVSQRQHELVCEVPESGLWVQGDPLRLTQVLGNLLINAAKYTGPRGRIVVSAWLDGADAVVQVRDNGVGIDAALLPQVFDLFEQGRVSIDRSRGGLGIGLAIVRSLVTMHGGSVAAESKGPGRGSAFTVRLPLASAGVRAEAPAAPALRACKAECILMVDDNRDGVDVLGELLSVSGYDVHIRYDPAAALAACETLHPRVVIVDIGLPVMDGYELATRIHARFPAEPPIVIAVTGYGQPQDHQRSDEAGIHAHLTKPVCAVTLMEHIRNAVG
jgi:signal transduction histidine kinase